MKRRLLNFYMGMCLLYIVVLVGTVNCQALLNPNSYGEIKIVFEEKGNLPLQEVRKWMGNLCHVKKEKIEVYRREHRIEVIIPYVEGNRIDQLPFNKGILYSGMPIQMIHYERNLNFAWNFLVIAVLLTFTSGGIFLLVLSVKKDGFERQVLN